MKEDDSLTEASNRLTRLYSLLFTIYSPYLSFYPVLFSLLSISPGAILFAADRQGNTLCHAASGVRQLGKDEPMSLDTPHWIASCTKAVTAIACLQLVEEGKVKLDDPVDKILPELGQAKIKENGKLRDPKVKTTLRMLLTHTCELQTMKRMMQDSDFKSSNGVNEAWFHL